MLDCCWSQDIRHDDGWTSWNYYHMARTHLDSCFSSFRTITTFQSWLLGLVGLEPRAWVAISYIAAEESITHLCLGRFITRPHLTVSSPHLLFSHGLPLYNFPSIQKIHHETTSIHSQSASVWCNHDRLSLCLSLTMQPLATTHNVLLTIPLQPTTWTYQTSRWDAAWRYEWPE